MSHVPPPHHGDPRAVAEDLRLGRRAWERHLRKELQSGGDLALRRARARDFVGSAAVVGTPEEVVACLRGLARTTAAHLAMVRADGRPVVLDVGGRTARLDGPTSADLLYLTDWMDAFHAALAVRDRVARSLLLPVPDDLWRRDGEAAIWRDAVDLLRDFFLGSDADPVARIDGLLARGAAGVGADVAGLLEADLLPCLRAWRTAFDGGDLTAVLVEGLEAHARFWPTVDEVDRPRGYIAPWLLGVAAWAWDIGIRVPLETPYLPRPVLELGRGPELTVCCPYCITPIDENAEQCAGCLEDPRRDAAMELGSDELVQRRARCPHCNYPLHHLAVRCGRCTRPLR